MRNISKAVTTSESIDILNLSGDYINKQNKHEFSLINSAFISTDEIYKIIDPANDQAFKILFNGSNKINHVTGLERAKSLIESLLYKFKGNILIKNIEYCPNEIPEVSGKNRKKLKVLDCPLLCKMNDDSDYIIDLEMQTYDYNGLDLNALGYGTALRNAYNLPVIIIVLLLKNSDENNSFEIKPFKRYSNETEFKPIDDYVYVFCIDLYYILDCINNNSIPNLGQLEISTTGKEWIKLLTIRDWMKKLNRGENRRYPLPRNLNNSKEIISAIMVLDSDNNQSLIKKLLKESEKDIIIDEIIKKDRINIWINSFSLNVKLNQLVVPFPEVAPEFLIKEVKNVLVDKNQCISFVKMLVNEKIIPNKKIYQKLIDENYH